MRTLCAIVLFVVATAGPAPSPPACWTGVVGANSGQTCGQTTVYTTNEFKKAECSRRSVSNKCVENNKDVGMGDGCPDQKDDATCKAYKNGEKDRTTDESFDGTTNHCRWAPTVTSEQKKANCEVGGSCTFYADRGEQIGGVSQGNCEDSAKQSADEDAWKAKRGTECEKRVKNGCFDNKPGSYDESDLCKSNTDASTCVNATGECSEGACSGSSNDESNCADKTSEFACTEVTCTWTKQCCRWDAPPTDFKETCVNHGKGTLDGVCSYNDGKGPPSAGTLKLGFDNKLFSSIDTTFITADRFKDQCAIIASFRTGYGSATALGSSRANMLGDQCAKPAAWEAIGEHMNHTKTSIAEYCKNFVPDTSSMLALKNYNVTFIIDKVEQGQFDAVFPGLVGLLYIVTGKPEIGKCLFTASSTAPKWGVAMCSCGKKQCNGHTAMGLIIDPATGPMRLLQFIDGSLATMKDAINAIVPNLMDSMGKLDKTQVSSVTEAKVTEMMKISGMTDKTNQAELWGIVKDYQRLLTAEANYKKSFTAYAVFKKVKIDASKVGAANTAAGVPLFTKDGIIMTVSLQNLPADKLKAVAVATGLSESLLTEAKTQASNAERGVPIKGQVRSQGKIRVKMSKSDAMALATASEGPAVFANSIALTLALPVTDVDILGIYVDDVKIEYNTSRRLADSEVRIDWEVRSATAVASKDLSGDTLKTNIVAEAKTTAGLTVAVTEAPTVDEVVTSGGTSTTGAAMVAEARTPLASMHAYLASLLFIMMLFA